MECAFKVRLFGRQHSALVSSSEVSSTTNVSLGPEHIMASHRTSGHWLLRWFHHRRKCCLICCPPVKEACASRQQLADRHQHCPTGIRSGVLSAASPSASPVPSLPVPSIQPLVASCFIIFCCSLLLPLSLISGSALAHANQRHRK